MESSNHEETDSPAGHLITKLSFQYWDSVASSIEHCPKVSHGNLKTTQDIAKTIGCSAETDRKALLLQTTSTQLLVLGEVKLMPTWSHHPYILGFLALE